MRPTQWTPQIHSANLLHLGPEGRDLRDAAEKAKSWLFTTLYRDFLEDADTRRVSRKSRLDELLMNSRRAFGSGKNRCRRGVSALGRLKKNFRAPLTLFYLSSSPNRNREVLNVPIGTLCRVWSRGKAQLRRSYPTIQNNPVRRVTR